MKDCPEEKTNCPCPEFSKEGLCDWPYRVGMTFQAVQSMTEILRLIDKSCSAVVQIDTEDFRTRGLWRQEI